MMDFHLQRKDHSLHSLVSSFGLDSAAAEAGLIEAIMRWPETSFRRKIVRAGGEIEWDSIDVILNVIGRSSVPASLIVSALL